MAREKLILVLLLSGLLALPALQGCGGAEVESAGMAVVEVEGGKVCGLKDGGVWTYFGIPYAAPPVGDLRWREPQPVEPWQGVLDASEYGLACPQPKTAVYDVGATGEDCLYLNVWSPAEDPGERYPVMVWIHGGSFTTGSAGLETYDGHNLAEKGVVLVSFNYRLGPFGFLSHPALSAESPHGVSGNYGFLDQIAALEWVQRNISAFGGDPGRVTVFGQSAGAVSAVDLMVSPLAQGLFHRVIAESGSFYSAFPSGWATVEPREDAMEKAYATGEKIAAELGCDKAEDVAGAMREKTSDEILEAAFKDYDAHSGTRFRIVVDGWSIPDDPAALFASGRQADVPLILGCNRNEGSLFLYGKEITPESYRRMMSEAYGALAGDVLALFPPGGSAAEASRALDEAITVMAFAAGARHAAVSMGNKGSHAYLYRFTADPDISYTRRFGVFHGLEVFYVFGNFSDFEVGAEDQELSRTIMGYWTNFAATGDPNGEGLPSWPAYDAAAEAYLEFGDKVEVRAGWYPEARAVIEAAMGE